jgi:hypothetical protein
VRAGDPRAVRRGQGRRVVRRRVVALPLYIFRILAHTTRALQLVFETIERVDTLEELERIRITFADLYADEAETLGELTRAIEARATVLRTQLRLFPAAPAEVLPSTDLEAAPPDLVRSQNARAVTLVRSAFPLHFYATENARADRRSRRIAPHGPPAPDRTELSRTRSS